MKGLSVFTAALVAVTFGVYLAIDAPAEAGAATYTVTRIDDPAPDACSPGDCSIREAVIAANEDANQDTISIPAGNYSLQIPGVAEDESLTGDIDILQPVLIQGAGSGATIIDAQQLDRIFDIPVVDEPLIAVQIADLTATNGQPPAGGDGAAIRSISDLTLQRVHLTNSDGDFGGGLVVQGGEADITDSVFAGNSSFSGGGISTFAGTDIFIEDTVFQGNSSGNGGGISIASTGTIQDSEFVSNSATFGGGGILSYGGNFNPDGVTLQRLTVHNNTATNRGGGIDMSGVNRLYDSVIYNNHAGAHGGGIHNTSANARLVNVTISGNTTDGFGGGYSHGSIAAGSVGVSGLPDVVMYHVTVSDNTADLDNNGVGGGGGIVNALEEIAVKSTIVSGNHDPNGDADCFGAIQLDDRNLIGQTSDGCELAGAGSDFLDTDPLIGPLADNGGATLTHALEAGSPVIDQGTECPDPDIDQRGAPRPFGEDCDLGAYEFGATPPIPAATPTPTPVAGKELVWADWNCADGPNPVDSLFNLRHDAGLATNTGDCPDMGQTVDVQDASEHIWGDADCSGVADPVDSLKVLRFNAGLSVSQEPECPEMGSQVTVTLP